MSSTCSNPSDFGGLQYDPNEKLYRLRYEAFHAVWAKTFQELIQRIEFLESRVCNRLSKFSGIFLTFLLTMSTAPTAYLIANDPKMQQLEAQLAQLARQISGTQNMITQLQQSLTSSQAERAAKWRQKMDRTPRSEI